MESISGGDVSSHVDNLIVFYSGTTHGYHAATFGLYLDQIVRRVDTRGRGIQQFFREEIGDPFGNISLFVNP